MRYDTEKDLEPMERLFFRSKNMVGVGVFWRDGGWELGGYAEGKREGDRERT